MTKKEHPTLLFKTDTRALSLKKALEFWDESAGSLYDFNIFQEDEFHTTHSTFRFGEVLLTHCVSVAQKLSRSNYRIGADGYDHFEIQFFIDGHWRRHDGREEAYAGPGDVVVHDAAQAHAGSASNFSNLTLFVPRPLLARLLINPDEHNMRVLAAHEPIVGLLGNHIDNLFRILPQLDEKQAATLVAPTLELIAATLNGVPREDSIQGIAAAQLASIRHYIDAHALEPDLSPLRIAATFTMSLRKLAYLFSNEGGVASYIQERRLNMARRALRDPAQVHKSIAEIGLEHGFTYAHNFTRAFQRLYGITPREARAVAQRHRLAGMNESQNWFDRASQWGR
ncbi:helix-turn-helix domain-containing protein [Agrobacterium vitis]|uniref:Helix-turn-helix domain-containing protein n=1 Tax=Agrobacterium vitis TaxID=373 RepID=A0A7K1RKD5_AGRVI|nr:helix-turn-helix domain-containing protein [Agrobacterium vitis]MCE6076349.1 helix-turn-helix domain-containing protein [Agrobacterium vitis]MVA58465.1 helix-turn-helix domain-containing protein [Agrobacterium vitis]